MPLPQDMDECSYKMPWLQQRDHFDICAKSRKTYPLGSAVLSSSSKLSTEGRPPGDKPLPLLLIGESSLYWRLLTGTGAVTEKKNQIGLGYTRWPTKSEVRGGGGKD